MATRHCDRSLARYSGGRVQSHGADLGTPSCPGSRAQRRELHSDGSPSRLSFCSDGGALGRGAAGGKRRASVRSPLGRRVKETIAGAFAPTALLAPGGWGAPHHGAPLPGSTVAKLAQASNRRQSIFVLPFENSGPDARRSDLAADITSEVANHVLNGADGPVIAGTAAQAYQGKPVDRRAIGSEHDVHFVLTGNVRRQEGRLYPHAQLSLRVKAAVLRAQGHWIEAEAVQRRVISLKPTESFRHYELGLILMAQGRHQEALVSFQTARRSAGGNNPVYWYDADIAMANQALGQFAEAMAAARLSIGEMPPDVGRSGELPSLALIAATAGSGNEEAARADLQKLIAAPRSWCSMSEI